MYLAHAKRIAVEKAEAVRNAMISGLWANSSLDDGKNTRTQALDEVQSNFNEMIKEIYAGKETPEAQEEFENHPLFQKINTPY